MERKKRLSLVGRLGRSDPERLRMSGALSGQRRAATVILVTRKAEGRHAVGKSVESPTASRYAEGACPDPGCVPEPLSCALYEAALTS